MGADLSIVAVILAKYLIYLIAAWAIVASVFVVHRRNFRAQVIWFFKILFTFFLFALLSHILQQFFPSTRPYILEQLEPLVYLPTSYSFPSGHAGQSAIMASFIFAINRSWGMLAFVLAGLVAVGRVLVGAHYVQDVVGGLIIGIILSVIVLKLSRRIK